MSPPVLNNKYFWRFWNTQRTAPSVVAPFMVGVYHYSGADPKLQHLRRQLRDLCTRLFGIYKEHARIHSDGCMHTIQWRYTCVQGGFLAGEPQSWKAAVTRYFESGDFDDFDDHTKIELGDFRRLYAELREACKERVGRLAEYSLTLACNSGIYTISLRKLNDTSDVADALVQFCDSVPPHCGPHSTRWGATEYLLDALGVYATAEYTEKLYPLLDEFDKSRREHGDAYTFTHNV